MFLVGFLGWVWDAFDFFTVSLCITEIAGEFGVPNSNVSWVSSEPWVKKQSLLMLTILFTLSPLVLLRYVRATGSDGDIDASPRGRTNLRALRRPLWEKMAHDHQPRSVRGAGVGFWIL